MADINKLGRYDILRVLGKARWAWYVGVDPNLERQVAIKTIRMQTLSPQAATEFEGGFARRRVLRRGCTIPTSSAVLIPATMGTPPSW